MKVIAIASTAAALYTTASAISAAAFNGNATCDESKPKVRVFNRCSYPVYLWSVLKGQGCPSDSAVKLETGGFYQENFREPVDGCGISLKLSKTTTCGADSTAQLEYFLEKTNPGYNYNYLDMSYVNCGSKDCPTSDSGYYLKSGNTKPGQMKNEVNEICPILSCSGFEDCAKFSYINPDDRQTKSCALDAPLDLHLCGSEAPGSEPAAPSKAAPAPEKPKPTAVYTPKVEAAPPVVTPAAEPQHIKTEVVYVTQYDYVNAKRHVHGHRHQHFRA